MEINQKYSKKCYWDARFNNEESYEWIAEFEEFGELLLKHIKPNDKILHIGCGNSQLSQQLFDKGYKNITNLDFSSVIVNKGNICNPHFNWICDDMRTLSNIESNSFDIVLEKAAIESLTTRDRIYNFKMSELNDNELERLRMNADNLSHCLHSLMARIRDLESKNGDPPMKISNPEKDTSDCQVCSNETITTDEKTGLKKKVIVTERVLTTKTFHAIPDNAASNNFKKKIDINELTCENNLPINLVCDDDMTINEKRIIKVPGKEIHKLNLECINGKYIINKKHKLNNNLKIGEIIEEVNGEKVTNKNQLLGYNDSLDLVVRNSLIGEGNTKFMKLMENNCSAKMGSILEVLDKNDYNYTVRNINYPENIFSLPASTLHLNVSLISPLPRRVICLVGSRGVGRSSIKHLLLTQCKHVFSTIIPYTTRKRLNGEIEGLDYNYITKREFLSRVRSDDFFEFGEVDNVLYGSSKSDIRRLIRTGKIVIIDSSMNGVRNLSNREFMPFTICIKAPSLSELMELNNKIYDTEKTETELEKIYETSEKFSNNDHRNLFDITIVNRNHDLSVQKILTCLDNLKNQSLWTPTSWIF
uniref:Guanylate kinase-like domain-containing protein n=1 Tax=Parastrongyloides trichosuri TaxID=131310 RepID=A0A0N4ZVF6_PARTI